MELLDCFKYLYDNINSVVISTVDAKGLPEARIIGLMGYGEEGLYFSTGAGKNFYETLVARPTVVVTGTAGTSPVDRVAVSVRGSVCEVEDDVLLKKLFDANPYFYDIYPTEESRKTVRLFCVNTGTLEWFDLGKKPIERYSFTFGDTSDEAKWARKVSIINRLAHSLIGEYGLNSATVVPEETQQQVAFIKDLLAAHKDIPLSADAEELVQLFLKL